jgi:hypothetical protein
MHAEHDPTRIFDLVMPKAVDLFASQALGSDLREGVNQLADLIGQISVGIGFMDSTGTWLMANSTMRRFVPEQIPSRDPNRIERWRAFDVEGRLIDPADWPGARAMRGDTVTPGMEMIHTTNEGDKITARVAAAPVRRAGHIVGAIVVVQEIESETRSGMISRA